MPFDSSNVPPPQQSPPFLPPSLPRLPPLYSFTQPRNPWRWHLLLSSRWTAQVPQGGGEARQERNDEPYLVTKTTHTPTSVQPPSPSVTTAIILVPHPNPFRDSLRSSQYPLFRPSSAPQYTLHGASAGALCATLWSSNVAIEDATREAIRLSDEVDLWNRKFGLYGIWGDIIRTWLDNLLPPEEVFAPPSNVNILLTPATYPHLTSLIPRRKVSQFLTRADLVDATMASVHLPLFLDNKLTSEFQTKSFIDGR